MMTHFCTLQKRVLKLLNFSFLFQMCKEAILEQQIFQRCIKHTRTPPYHAASHGAAERLVRTTKTALLKQVFGDMWRESTKERLDDFLISYRNTPTSVTARVPVELFLKQLPCIKLSLLKLCFACEMAGRQQQYADQHIQVRESMQYFCVNDKVYVRTTRGETESWQERVVEKAVSPATYLVKVGNAVHFTHVDHL